MGHARKLRIEGRLQVTEMTGAWGIYAGERIVIGPGESFRDDLGIKIREAFEQDAAEALRDGRSPSERFQLPSVRVTVELVEPGRSRLVAATLGIALLAVGGAALIRSRRRLVPSATRTHPRG